MTRRDPRPRACAITVLALGGFLAVGQHAWAFDTAEVYRQGAIVISGEGGYGAQLHLYDPFTGLEAVTSGDPRPCQTGLVVKGLAREEMLIEIDAWGFIDDPE